MIKTSIHHFIHRKKNQGNCNNDPTFKEIYEAINYDNKFNEPQLFYLSRLIERKLKAFEPRLGPEDLETKPYQ